ncbi:MAG TPA: fibronectin type III domain-containing protein [Terriglobales bacterium]|nr:fibronectin type III domain-containing protein [Terriglobales bacterium]
MNRRATAAIFTSILLVSGVAALGQQPIAPGRIKVYLASPNVSPPLRHLPPLSDKRVPREMPIRFPHPAAPGTPAPDPALQDTAGPAVATSTGFGFDGIGVGLGTYSPSSAPPDTNGDVGATQYVQWVNTSFAIFDKATGALLYGPAAGNTLFAGVGGPCQNDNDGDPIVQYDQLANRWVLTQLAGVDSGPPYYQCVAVSMTSDATGSYWRYVWAIDDLNDYPKLSVWPNAYYLTFNRFLFGILFSGASACALERSDMLIGQPAWMICYNLSSSYASLLPGDLDGNNLPPPGAPGLFFNLGTNSVNLWRMQPDFVTPDNTTLTGPINIPVAAFTRACAQSCVPQPNTSQRLDALGDRPMYRLAYRNFGDHESLVVNHSIVAGSSIGVRWYEIRNPFGSPVVFQQGTFAPDNEYRWMGSIAMDAAGNIAVGYSVSSGVTRPSIRYTGRVASDPLGTMQGETAIIDGTGSQLPSLNRWGDYSSMTVDAADDCTFWYTTEYLKNDGTFNWSTRIASFSFPGCAAPPASPPNAPSGLLAAGTSSSQIDLAWTDNSDNEDGFRVERCTGTAAFCDASPGNFSQIVQLPANSNAYSDTGLSASTTFAYRVRAFNGAGDSGYSNTAEASTQAPPPPPSPPAAPSGLSAVAGSSGNSRFVNLSWTDNSNNEDNFTLERCQVNKNGVCNFTVIATLAVNSTAYTDNGVSRRKAYRYRIKARNSVGDSAYSNTAQVTTP